MRGSENCSSPLIFSGHAKVFTIPCYSQHTAFRHTVPISRVESRDLRCVCKSESDGGRIWVHVRDYGGLARGHHAVKPLFRPQPFNPSPRTTGTESSMNQLMDTL